MIQIRTSVFETNSSSIHSICISRGPRGYAEPAYVEVALNDYGWNFEKLDTVNERASYAYSLAATIDFDMGEQMKEAIFDVCSEMDIDVDFSSNFYDFYGVDHAGDAIEFVHDVLRSKKLLRDFIFRKDSCVFTGNDNSDAPKHHVLDEDSWHDKNPGGIAYFKGN